MCLEGEKGIGGREHTGSNFSLILMGTRKKKTWHPPIVLYFCPTGDSDNPSSPSKSAPTAPVSTTNIGVNDAKTDAGVGRRWHLRGSV